MRGRSSRLQLCADDRGDQTPGAVGPKALRTSVSSSLPAGYVDPPFERLAARRGRAGFAAAAFVFVAASTSFVVAGRYPDAYMTRS